MKNKQYIVYNRAGEYHHGYNARLEGALGWAIDCAKTVRGLVKEVSTDGKQTVVFDCSPQSNVRAN
jgi:hypothetical protein